MALNVMFVKKLGELMGNELVTVVTPSGLDMDTHLIHYQFSPGGKIGKGFRFFFHEKNPLIRGKIIHDQEII